MLGHCLDRQGSIAMCIDTHFIVYWNGFLTEKKRRVRCGHILFYSLLQHSRDLFISFKGKKIKIVISGSFEFIIRHLYANSSNSIETFRRKPAALWHRAWVLARAHTHRKQKCFNLLRLSLVFLVWKTLAITLSPNSCFYFILSSNRIFFVKSHIFLIDLNICTEIKSLFGNKTVFFSI